MSSRQSARSGHGCEEPSHSFLAAPKTCGIRLVVDERPASFGAHQAGIAQDPQVLGDGTLRDAELHGQGVDAEGPVDDQAKNAQTHLDREGSQESGNIRKVSHGLGLF